MPIAITAIGILRATIGVMTLSIALAMAAMAGDMVIQASTQASVSAGAGRATMAGAGMATAGVDMAGQVEAMVTVAMEAMAMPGHTTALAAEAMYMAAILPM